MPDQEYHFRICAVRFIDDALRNSAPNAPAQIKGQFNNTLRVRIPVETAVDEAKQRTNDETLKDEDIKKEMSDTQVSLIILLFFLIIGIIFALSVWFLIGEINF